MNEASTNPGNRSASEIENDVERTRESVSETLDALRGRLEPGQIVDQMVDRVAEYARGSGGVDFARNLGSALRDNPLPVMLIGAGIGWLLLSNNQGMAGAGHDPHAGDNLRARNSGSGTSRRLADGGERMAGAAQAVRGTMDEASSAIGDATSAASDYVSQAASTAAEYASRAASGISEWGSRMVDRASEAKADMADSLHSGWDTAGEGASRGVRGVAEGAHGLVEAQPLLLGALGFALGASLGAVLPRTRTEDEWLGEARASVMQRVSAASTEAMDELRSVAGETAGQMRRAVTETAARVKEEASQGDLDQAASDTIRAVGDAVTGAAQEAGHRFQQPKPGQQPRGTG